MFINLLKTRSKNNRLLQQGELFHMFQPVYGLTSNVCLGYEALLRSASYNPETLFRFAEEHNQKYELDLLSIKESTKTFFDLPKSCLLFVNVLPSTLIRSFVFSHLCEFKHESIPHGQIVLEISESEAVEDLYQFGKIIRLLRESGYRVAVDDMGKGASTLATVTTIEPDIIKFDKWFSENLSQMPNKQDCLERMVRFCGSDVQSVLEGIETAEDLATARSIGIGFGQGYYLGRPSVDQHLVINHKEGY